ncbi:DUF4880 domain-containing protein [Marinomonas foliarum]|uniref:DUF4880 domain-containing protein n=1 Tax=Marinomonas foliarum TaxID=491950 RepID=A0ABX7IRZ1_9GAMM|nr:DUF4880 domain-containing protein [Marinomonas foliarum]QRV25123.1 DUF4880 domain-containing protein [Marinomonas foliarum]
MSSSTQPNHAHLEAASEWFAVLSDKPVAEDDLRAWQTWLSEDEAHRKAWHQVESVGAIFSSFQSTQQSAGYVLEHSQAMSRRQLMKGMLGVTGVAVLGWVGWNETPLPTLASSWMADFHTQVGQVSHHDLEGGIQVWLNTNSAMNRSFGDHYHSVSLVAGEMMIQTQSAEGGQVFSAACRDGVINVGMDKARFCIRQLSDSETVLAVYEGAVSLTPLESDLAKTFQAGQEVTFTAHSMSNAKPSSSLYDTWRNGLLIVEDMPLVDFIDEIGRYHYGYINLDSSVADLRVVGTFPNHNLSIVLSMLSKSFPIRVKHPLPWWVSISAA